LRRGGFADAQVVLRNCVPEYRDRTRFVSCKLEHFAETRGGGLFIHLNFMATFAPGEFSLAYTANCGEPPGPGRRGVVMPAAALDLVGVDGEPDLAAWAAFTYGEFAGRWKAFHPDDRAPVEIGLRCFTDRAYLATIDTAAGEREQFLVREPAPDEGIVAEFRAAFGTWRRDAYDAPRRTGRP
jgi:hypothetical protein